MLRVLKYDKGGGKYGNSNSSDSGHEESPLQSHSQGYDGVSPIQDMHNIPLSQEGSLNLGKSHLETIGKINLSSTLSSESISLSSEGSS